MSTLTKSDVSALSQTIDRTLRHMKHSKLLSEAKRSGDTLGQLEHSLHVADTKIGMAKSPSEADHWRGVHRQVSDLIVEAGYQWRGGRLIDPRAPRSMAKSFRVSAAVATRGMEPAPVRDTEPEFADADKPLQSLAKSFAAAGRASEYQALRGEIMQAIGRARSAGETDERIQLCQVRADLEKQAQAEGLRRDSDIQFVPMAG